jgi:metal-sulfur cluster biosynthetic enzyme
MVLLIDRVARLGLVENVEIASVSIQSWVSVYMRERWISCPNTFDKVMCDLV